MIPYTPETLYADQQLTADELRLKYFDPADRSGGEGEHPRFSKWDWLQVVAQRSTVLGYWEWVEAQVEQAYDKEG
jgi:hypothetical protein